MDKKPSYEELRDLWYDKLEQDYKDGKSDFYDIERDELRGASRHYRHSSTDKYGKYSREWQESKAEYSYLATRFLNEYEFKSSLDQIIWEYHTNGISIRSITKLLNDAQVTTMRKTQIGEKLKKLKDTMKRMYVQS